MRALAVLLFVATAAGCGSQVVVEQQGGLSLADLRAPAAPASYFLGAKFEGLPLTAIVDSRQAPDFIYGDCTPPSGIDAGGCFPPLEVQHWLLSKRPPSKFAADIRCHVVAVPGRTAAVFESTGGMEVYVGNRTVVIFADSEARMKRAAAALRAVKGGPLPAPPPWVVRQLAGRCSRA